MDLQADHNNGQPSCKNIHNPQLNTSDYLNDTIGAFDHSFSNSIVNVDEVLNTLPPVQKVEDFSVNGLPMMKESEGSKLKILTGNITQILKWNRSLTSSQLYETIGVYISDWDNGQHYQRILLIRQPRGPVMKVVTFHTKYPEVPQCIPGQYLKIIGRISEENMMIADKILIASETDFYKLERVTQICERVIKHF